MTPPGPVHLIYLGGDFGWQNRRAVETAHVHGAPVWLWCAPVPTGGCAEGLPARFEPLVLPDWLRDHPIQLANVKDLYAWEILSRHGGLYLDLDTVSLAPVWDLLTRDVLVSTEWPNPSDGEHPYNSAVVAGKAGAPVLGELASRAREILVSGESRWGKTGPHLLTDVVAEYPAAFDLAPHLVLSGWRDDTIHRYYDGERPGPDVRVVHCYQSSRPERFAADCWRPLRQEEVTAVIPTRGDVNMAPIMESLIFDNVVVWNNDEQDDDVGAFGRYVAAAHADTEWIYTQDDDCIVPADMQRRLLFEHDDGTLLSNMNPNHNAGLPHLALPGWGAVFRKDAAGDAFARWWERFPDDDPDDFCRIGCDIVFPVLTPSRMVDLGHENLPHAHAPDRTSLRPGYQAKKLDYYRRAEALR